MCDYEIFGKVVKVVISIFFIVNGDICIVYDVKFMIEEIGVDVIMVGCGVCSNFYIFI